MPVKVACSCGKRFTAKDEFAGRKTKCPGCGQPLVIPQPQSGADELEVLDAPAAWPADPLAPAAPPPGPFGAGPPGGAGVTAADILACTPGGQPPGFPAGGGPMYGMPAAGGPGAFMPPAGGPAYLAPAFPAPAAPRKRGKPNTTLYVVGGLIVAIGIPCVGLGGCVFLGVINAARQAARQAQAGPPISSFPSTLPSTPTYSPLDAPADAATQAANDAFIESYIKLLEDYASAASQIRDLASAEAHATRVEELGNEINRRQVEVQIKLTMLPAAEGQRTNQKYGTRLKAAQERAQQEDSRLLQLSSQLQIEAMRSRIDSLTPPLPTGPPGT
jgi:hypothetical protein